MNAQKLVELIGQHEIMASNGQGWGKGKTIAEAAANCRKATRKAAKVFAIIPAGSEIDGLSIGYPADAKFFITKL